MDQVSPFILDMTLYIQQGARSHHTPSQGFVEESEESQRADQVSRAPAGEEAQV